MLNNLGVKGITYDGRRDGRCFVVFDDKAISIINSYNQAAGISINDASARQLKGQTKIMTNGRRVIQLFKQADQSTFIHECAHMFLADMRELTSMPEAPERLKKDLATIEKWANWKEGQMLEYKGTALEKEFGAMDKAIRVAQATGFADYGGQEMSLTQLLDMWEQERFAVVPAYAGMIPQREQQEHTEYSSPRTCGADLQIRNGNLKYNK